MKSRISQTLIRLQRSAFRSRFKLSARDLRYIEEKGMDTIRAHARDFISKRIAPAFPSNDGRQTPMKNHPVFIAQHATATCCRGCVEKWHRISKGRVLAEDEIAFVIDLIMAWIEGQAAGGDLSGRASGPAGTPKN